MGTNYIAHAHYVFFPQVFRSLEEYNGDTISSYYYLPFTVRILAVFTIVKLFLNEEVPLSVKELFKNIK